MKPKKIKPSSSKRRYSSNEESASSNDENIDKAPFNKKPIEKKVKERTSSPTTDDDPDSTKSKEKVALSEELEQIVSYPNSVSLKLKEEVPLKERTGQFTAIHDGNVEITKEEAIREREEMDISDVIEQVKGPSTVKDEIKEIEQLWSAIEGKQSISVGTKGPRNAFLYDYLGEEVDKDEAEALEALSSYWLNTVAKNAAIPRTDIPEEYKGFYDKYCNGTRELTAESAMKIMMLPHVVTVTLKSNAKIEVVVADVFFALQDSPELRHDDFECVEAMGMHLF